MHASLAYVNGAGTRRRGLNVRTDLKDLSLLNALLSSPDSKPALDRGKSKDERQAEDESAEPSATKPGGFKNDPDDSTNPNEVRERHIKKINR
jgi:hypothetical protein